MPPASNHPNKKQQRRPASPFRWFLLALVAILLFLAKASSNLFTEIYLDQAIQGRLAPKDSSQDSTSTQQSPTGEATEDADCPFRDSPIYRSVYVYPEYGDVANGWSGDILSEAGRNLDKLAPWPWLELRRMSQQLGTSHYDISCQHIQYATELLVRELMVNPKSCLRTDDPEKATLFYVPYLPSVEHHRGENNAADYALSPYGRAIEDIIEKKDYDAWESLFGLTSKYWKRRGGSDHILVFSEPMHGLSHPRSRRGNFHFVNTQKQLKPPIVISVELSTTFVQQYPKCAAKNILMPYPNTDGRWFNGKMDQETSEMLATANITVSSSAAALAAEKAQSKEGRPIAQFYSAGNHGTCRNLRKAMTEDYRSCSPSYTVYKESFPSANHAHGMRLSTLCPCPGGDSPSAKRMFDSIIAGCIPVILSKDFVWPFTSEFDPSISLDPNEFSLRLEASDYEVPQLDAKTCNPLNETKPGLQKEFEAMPTQYIQRLRQGIARARHLYSWYDFSRSIPDNPLRENVLPTGGAAHALVAALGERAAGAFWSACEEELKSDRGPDARQFLC